jgi:peptidoglycan/LPS O-acetylase OafA/YrhL
LFFFVHTSLVLLRSLGRLMADGDGHVTARFLWQRVFRIYPLYWAALAFTLMLGVPDVNTLGIHATGIQNLTFDIPGSSPMWSLAYEMQMYVALPAVYLLTRSGPACSRDAGLRLLLVSFAAAVVSIALFTAFPSDAMHMPLTYFAPCFLSSATLFAGQCAR